MCQIIRNRNESVESFCFRICEELKVSWKAFKLVCNYENGEFSKHISLFKLMHHEANEMIKNVEMTRQQFFGNARHRTILDVEVMLDIDNRNLSDIPVFRSIKDKAKWCRTLLKFDGFKPVTYFTGNKSYHISIIRKELRRMSKEQRREEKRKMLERFGADLLKDYDGALISLEGSVHYKSGKEKTMVEL